jgi:hypothetical protein
MVREFIDRNYHTAAIEMNDSKGQSSNGVEERAVI